jgi:hypothetical protein
MHLKIVFPKMDYKKGNMFAFRYITCLFMTINNKLKLRVDHYTVYKIYVL